MEYKKKGGDKTEVRHLTESVDSEQDLSNGDKSQRRTINEDKRPNKPTIVIENGVHSSNGNGSLTAKIEKPIIPVGKQEMSPFEVAQQRNNLNFTTNQTSKTSQTDAPAPTAFFNKDLQTECLLHKVQGRDTIQGIALKYGVEVITKKSPISQFYVPFQSHSYRLEI